MARYTDSKCKQCLREHQKLYLKGSKCYTSKCPFTRRNGALPGSSKFSYRRQTDFGVQFREKQKIKRIYGVLERQFRRYYDMAMRMEGDSGLNLLRLLELRLDNVVFRLGYAPNRATARQMVSHGHFLLNGKTNKFPSTILNEGDVVELKITSQGKKYFENPTMGVDNKIPLWIDKSEKKGKVSSLPNRDFFDQSIQDNLVIEYYSR